VTARWQNRDIFNVAFVGAGSDATIELIGPPFLAYEQAFVDRRNAGINHLSFQVADADATYAELKAKGLKVAWEPRDMVVVRQCAFYDEDGILVEVFHHLDDNLPLMPPDLDQTGDLRLQHVDILADDWRRAQQFYEKHFGLKTIYEYVDEFGGAFTFLVDPFFNFQSHNFMLEIIGPPFAEEREHDFHRKTGAGIDHLAYISDNLHASWQKTLDSGAENMMDPYDAYGATIAWIKDADGNDIELMTPIPEEIVRTALETGKPFRV